VALSRPKHGFESRWGRHACIGELNHSRQSSSELTRRFWAIVGCVGFSAMKRESRSVLSLGARCRVAARRRPVDEYSDAARGRALGGQGAHWDREPPAVRRDVESQVE
jgi:hypothetical protein